MLKAGGGRIINFSSNAGRTSSPALGVHYTAAKAGVLGLTRPMRPGSAVAACSTNTAGPPRLLRGGGNFRGPPGWKNDLQMFVNEKAVVA